MPSSFPNLPDVDDTALKFPDRSIRRQSNNNA